MLAPIEWINKYANTGTDEAAYVALYPADPGPAGKNGRSLPFEEQRDRKSVV